MKSKIKKYLPNFLYILVYTTYKYIRSNVFGKKDNSNLIHFTKPILKDVSYKGICYKIKIDPKNGLIDKEIYNNGVWEPEILEVLKENISQESVCLDIGANIGQHTLYMASLANKGRVYSFEPLKKLVDQIKESVIANNFKNIEIYNFGLSNTSETLNIYLDNLNIGRSTFDKRKEASSIEKADIKVFDDIWGDNKIDFLKMDVEGYEYYALQGMKNNILKSHPKMLLEFTPLFYNKMNISSSEILEFILNLNYKIYDIDNNRKEVTKQNIQEFLTHTPIQTNILCLPL